MPSLRMTFATALLFLGTWSHRSLAQRQDEGCGTAPDSTEIVQYLKPRFLSTDSIYIEYRSLNRLEQLDSTAVMTKLSDTGLCATLSSKLHARMAAWRGWQTYWADAQWTENFFRFGPYYVALVTQVGPADLVGRLTVIQMFDVDTLEPRPLHAEIL